MTRLVEQPSSLPTWQITVVDGAGEAGAEVEGGVDEAEDELLAVDARVTPPNLRPSSALSEYSYYQYSGRSSPLLSSPYSHRRPASALSGASVKNSQHLHDLRLAAIAGRTEEINKILDAGMCVDQTLRQGWTALMYAASSAQPVAVALLLRRQADPNMHKELFTPLMAACASSASDTIGNNADKTTHEEKELPLEISSTVLACVQELLEHGARVDATERHRLTALMFASKTGRPHIVRCLLKAAAARNCQDNKGWSALCWASHGGHGAVVRELLCPREGCGTAADATLVTTHGQTAADIARGQQHFKLAEVVEEAALGTPITAPSLQAVAALGVSSRPATPAPASYCSDLDMVLAGLELSYLSPLFHKHKVTLAGFLRLSGADLARLGVAEVGIQTKLMTAIAEMHRKAWEPSSVTSLNVQPSISLIDAASMLGNVNKHVTFLEATLSFLRHQLEETTSVTASHHLHHNTSTTTITTLTASAADAVTAIARLHATTSFLALHLKKLSQCSVHMPGDLIVTVKHDPPRCWNRGVVAVTATFAATVALTLWLRPQFIESLFEMRPHTDHVLLDI